MVASNGMARTFNLQWINFQHKRSTMEMCLKISYHHNIRLSTVQNNGQWPHCSEKLVNYSKFRARITWKSTLVRISKCKKDHQANLKGKLFHMNRPADKLETNGEYWILNLISSQIFSCVCCFYFIFFFYSKKCRIPFRHRISISHCLFKD